MPPQKRSEFSFECEIIEIKSRNNERSRMKSMTMATRPMILKRMERDEKLNVSFILVFLFFFVSLSFLLPSRMCQLNVDAIYNKISKNGPNHLPAETYEITNMNFFQWPIVFFLINDSLFLYSLSISLEWLTRFEMISCRKRLH